MQSQPSEVQSSIQPQQNFVKTSSTLSMQSSVPTSPSNCEGQKLFHRKPSFKYYQRKQKKESDPNNKICFISPQKSEIFKKFTPYRPTQTDLNTSYFTNNSSQVNGPEEMRKSFKSTKPNHQTQDSRTIFYQINNIKMEDVFRTPKNVKNQSNYFTSSSNLRKMSFNRPKGQQLSSLSQSRTNFDRDFDSLLQTKNSQYQISKKVTTKLFIEQKDFGFDANHESKQGNFNNFDEVQILSLQLTILKSELDKMSEKCNTLQSKKSQLEDSSKLFLQEIKALQAQVQNLSEQKQRAQQQISRLNFLLTEKDIIIKENQEKVTTLMKQSQIHEQKVNQQQANENYKVLYFEVNQKLKYLDVQNCILKKLLDEKKQDQKNVQRLEGMNKKLLTKNKNLIKQIEKLQEQLEEYQNDSKSRRQTPRNSLQKNLPKGAHHQQSSHKNHGKVPSFILSKGFKNNDSFTKLQKCFDTIQEGEIVSSGSLEFSFELSPQKSYHPSKFKQQSLQSTFKTPRKCFN